MTKKIISGILILISIIFITLAVGCGNDNDGMGASEKKYYDKVVQDLHSEDYKAAKYDVISLVDAKSQKGKDMYYIATAIIDYNEKHYVSAKNSVNRLSEDALNGEFADKIREINNVDPVLVQQDQERIDKLKAAKEAKDAEVNRKLKALADEVEAENKEKEAHSIHIGDSKNTVIQKWGNPMRVNRTQTANGVSEQLVYGNQYVYIDDGIVTAIQN